MAQGTSTDQKRTDTAPGSRTTSPTQNPGKAPTTDANRSTPTETAQTATSDQIIALPPTTPWDAWNAFARQDRKTAAAVLAATLKMLPSDDVWNADDVKRAYGSLSHEGRRQSVTRQAQGLHNLILDGGESIGLKGGASPDQRGRAASHSMPGGSRATTSQTAPNRGNRPANPHGDSIPGLPANNMVHKLTEAAKQSGVPQRQRTEVVTLAQQLLQALPCSPELPLTDLVATVNWVREVNEELRAELLRHPHVVYAIARQKRLKNLLTTPDTVNVLSNASNLLEALVTQKNNWYVSHGQETMRFLLREGVANELENDPELRNSVLSAPQLLRNLNGRMDLIRMIVHIKEPVLAIASLFPDFGNALLEVDDPLEAVWSLGIQVVAPVLYSQSRKYPKRSFLDVFRLVMTDQELGEVIRGCPAQLNLVVSSAEILLAVKAMPDALLKLSESPELTDVLEELPDLARRLLSDMDLITAAVDNKSVAYALSCKPHQYDTITDKYQLKQALDSTPMPQGFPVPKYDDTAADIPSQLQQALSTPAPKHPGSGLLTESIAKLDTRYKLVQAMMAVPQNELQRLPAEDGDAAIAVQSSAKVMQYLRVKNPAVRELLNSESESDKELVQQLHSDRFDRIIRHMARYPRVIAMPHQLRRILISSAPSSLQLPQDPFAALYMLLTAARYPIVLDIFRTASADKAGLFVSLIRVLPDLRAHLYDSPVLAYLSARTPDPVQHLPAALLANNPWLASTLEYQFRVINLLPELDPENSAEMSALLAEDSALLRLIHRRWLANEFTGEEWPSVVNAVNRSAGPLKQLVPVFGKLPSVYWKRLLTGRLYELLSERHGQALTKALIRFPRVLREAIARPGFTRMWETQAGLLEEQADRALRTSDEARNDAEADAAVQALADEVSKSAGEAVLTPEGFELDPDLTDRLRALITGLDRREAPDTLRDAVPGLEQNVIAAYSMVLGDERLRAAAMKNSYLAQGLFFTPSMLELLITRPSLVDQTELNPEMLRQLISVPGLPELLTHQDAAYAQYVRYPLLRENYTAAHVATVKNNPDMIPAIEMLREEIGGEGYFLLFGLLQISRAAARAVIEREATLGLLLRLPTLVIKLVNVLASGQEAINAAAAGEGSGKRAVTAGGEAVVRAVVAARGRLEACSVDPSLVKVVAGLPEEVVTVLGDRSDVASSAAGWAGLLKDRALVAELSAHPGLAETVLTPALLPVLHAAPLFVRVLAQAPEEVRAGLAAKPVRDLLRKYPKVGDTLLRVPALCHALARLRALPELLMKQPELRNTLKDRPELTAAFLTNRLLITEAERSS
ncbi:hypothetical protein ACIOWI_36745, partial [Streptomyces sp. NPDC087659]|uniref:hypothetical protein n=1 Tax=Streptomyces sp. NPDC087659 TaxID=3365801 RepID=UPI003808F044